MEAPLVDIIRSVEDFEREVGKLRDSGWTDADYIARQIVDDYYRHTGISLHHVQHLVEAVVQKLLGQEVQLQKLIETPPQV